MNLCGSKSLRGRSKLVTEHILQLGLKHVGVMELYFMASRQFVWPKDANAQGKNENNSNHQEEIDFMNSKNLKYRSSMQLFKCLLNRDLFSNMEICSSYIFKT